MHFLMGRVSTAGFQVEPKEVFRSKQDLKKYHTRARRHLKISDSIQFFPFHKKKDILVQVCSVQYIFVSFSNNYIKFLLSFFLLGYRIEQHPPLASAAGGGWDGNAAAASDDDGPPPVSPAVALTGALLLIDGTSTLSGVDVGFGNDVLSTVLIVVLPTVVFPTAGINVE
jgi:hypothetical protein